MKLERLQAHLSSPQLEAILTGIAGSQDSKLRELTCTGADISGMDPEILSEALVKLETVGGGRLSPGQVLALFSRISESPNLRLTKLDLDWNISMVPPEMFAGALSRLERVQFWRGTGVTADQLESLFLMLFSHQVEAGGSTLTLKHVKFYGTDLTSVSLKVVVGAIQRLEEVVVWGGTVSAKQINAILTMVKDNRQGRLKDLVIFRPDVVGTVTPTLLQQASMNNAVRINVMN